MSKGRDTSPEEKYLVKSIVVIIVDTDTIDNIKDNSELIETVEKEMVVNIVETPDALNNDNNNKKVNH